MSESVGDAASAAPLARHQAAHRLALPQVRLLDVDPPLGYELTPRELEVARAQLAVGVLKRPVGEWSPLRGQGGSGPMMTIVAGFLLRSTELAGRRSAQLLGPGDLIAPLLEPDVAEETSPEWRCLTNAALLVLDDRTLNRISAFPAIGTALMHRWGAQAQRAAAQMDIVKQSHIEMRVMLMLWHFAQRWGRVLPEGILLPLPLTHAILGQLVGARRPTVSLAVKQLEREGALARATGGAWLLDERFLSEAGAPRPRRMARATSKQSVANEETTPAPILDRIQTAPSPETAPTHDELTERAVASSTAPAREPIPPARASEVELLRDRIEALRRAHERNVRRTANTLRRAAEIGRPRPRDLQHGAAKEPHS